MNVMNERKIQKIQKHISTLFHFSKCHYNIMVNFGSTAMLNNFETSKFAISKLLSMVVCIQFRLTKPSITNY